MSNLYSKIRSPFRAKFFEILRRAFRADDGRLALSDSLRDQLAWRRHELLRLSGTPSPYDLGTTSCQPATSLRSDIVLISARFRSGSTLLWNIFRNIPGCVSYYEPFNERCWFNPALRGQRVDSTHRGIETYWQEYEGCEHLSTMYDPQWQESGFYMSAGDWNPPMKRFIESLIECSGDRRPVLQFNRVDFRLSWLRHTFPNAKLLHIFRHPRDQWCSVLQRNDGFPPNGRMQDFEQADHFYTRRWASDLKYQFPFLDERTVEHPYQLHYFLWKLSYLFGRTYSHCSISFEELVTRPLTVLFELLDTCGIDLSHVEPLVSLISPPPLGKWTAYADDAWFRRHETHCEDVLAEFFREAATTTPSVAEPASVATGVFDSPHTSLLPGPLSPL